MKILLGLAMGMLLLAGLWLWLVNDGDVTPDNSEIKLAMLDYAGPENDSEGVLRGCDRVVMVSKMITPTSMPLTKSIEELFALESDSYGGWNNFINKTNDTLFFDRATIEDGVAHIYLQGHLSGLAGVCDNPRAKIQIEETALQFDTVNDVKIYLNGEITDLTPDERGD